MKITVWKIDERDSKCKCYSKMLWLGFHMGFEGGNLILEEEYFKNCLILKLQFWNKSLVGFLNEIFWNLLQFIFIIEQKSLS